MSGPLAPPAGRRIGPDAEAVRLIRKWAMSPPGRVPTLTRLLARKVSVGVFAAFVARLSQRDSDDANRPGRALP